MSIVSSAAKVACKYRSLSPSPSSNFRKIFEQRVCIKAICETEGPMIAQAESLMRCEATAVRAKKQLGLRNMALQNMLGAVRSTMQRNPHSILVQSSVDQSCSVQSTPLSSTPLHPLQYSPIQSRSVLFSAVHSTKLHSTTSTPLQYSTVQISPVRCSPVHSITVRSSAVKCSAVQSNHHSSTKMSMYVRTWSQATSDR